MNATIRIISFTIIFAIFLSNIGCGKSIESVKTGSSTVSTTTQEIPIVTEHAGTTSFHPAGTVDGVSYGFIEYLPQDYVVAQEQKYPLVIFLHGGGDVGNGDLDSLMYIRGKSSLAGVQYAIDHGTYFNAVVLTPQSFATDPWWSSPKLLELLTYAMSHYKVDPKRVLVTGLSMGGGETWSFVGENASKIAAAMPICGATMCSTPNSENIVARGVKVWSFHALDDDVIDVRHSYSCMNDVGKVLGEVVDFQSNYNADSGDIQTAHFDLDTKQWNFENEFDCKDASGNPWSVPICQTLYKTGGHAIWERIYLRSNNIPMTWLLRQHQP